jgi:uncharacterized NAD(P)/FAD-binding protein YdhS
VPNSPDLPFPSEERSILIVGGGASAVFAVVALVECFADSGIPDITVIEREQTVGLGLAYGRADDHHLLNSPAGKMSPSAADDGWFVRWCNEAGRPVAPGDFVPRRLYGEFLVDVFSRLVSSSDGRIRSVRGEALSVRAEGSAAVVQLTDGRELRAGTVILALGNPPPAPRECAPGRVVADPWAYGALAAVRDGDRVLLIGTGLTMVDIATSLARRDAGIRMTATSRNLLLPRVHPERPAAPGPGLDASSQRLGDLVSQFGRDVRASRSAGSPWQAVVDGMRPQLNRIWANLRIADRQRFLRHAARRWDVHRHRMSPQANSELQSLLATGVLQLQASVDEADYDVVINCTGPRSVGERGWNPVVDSLLDAGLARADPLALGLDADEFGALRRSDRSSAPRLFAIGPALRGTLWETTALPEIRQEAVTLAAHLAETIPHTQQEATSASVP